MDKEKDISQKSISYIRNHKQDITQELLKDYNSVDAPLSIFMAGSPGAGKTEWAKGLVEVLDGNVFHLDGDLFRSILPGYEGNNSHLFQKAMSKLVSYIHDRLLDKNISFILDGTFSDIGRAKENILRSLKRNRKITIIYVYLLPEYAWKYTQDREQEEGRRILKDTFIQKYIGAYETIKSIRNTFSNKEVKLLLVNRTEIKSNNDINLISIANIQQLDEVIQKVYNKDELEQLL
jgi:UDP-N-acetylglucosamine kinase